MEPLTALGVTLELARLSMCSPSARTNWGPAAQMSAPESGRTTMLASPLHVVTFIVMVGAGVMDPADVPDSWTKGNSLCGSCVLNVRVCGIVLALCFCRGSVGFCRQTLLKWPILPQLRHDCL